MSVLLTPDFEELGDEERGAWIDGFSHCLWLYAVWNDGVQHIGCLQTPIKDIRTELERAVADLKSDENDASGEVNPEDK